ncbi:Hpt domain-containing protein [Alcanivorax sp. MM125-6]|nr:Hpt domain-containing protein [Alcanivorax sp. MM125-6]QJX01976.1 Hpt domain-containing protein [Alcanivorax sp. IO_7]UWN48599.1 hypothetical protein ASALC70_00784 [Alcanivorax sp. ALC70]|tara:strand:- start:19691 stop:20044 length:354 start_codon:yes stop_codon:yes gene_type:complete
MQQPPVLDETVLAELREVMGSDFETLVESYGRDGGQRLDALRQAVAQGDADQARQQAHSFKGSSSNLGARRVAAQCLELEQLARTGDLSALAERLDPLEDAFNESCRSLRALTAVAG